MECVNCGTVLSLYTKMCPECGTPRGELPKTFFVGASIVTGDFISSEGSLQNAEVFLGTVIAQSPENALNAYNAGDPGNTTSRQYFVLEIQPVDWSQAPRAYNIGFQGRVLNAWGIKWNSALGYYYEPANNRVELPCGLISWFKHRGVYLIHN